MDSDWIRQKSYSELWSIDRIHHAFMNWIAIKDYLKNINEQWLAYYLWRLNHNVLLLIWWWYSWGWYDFTASDWVRANTILGKLMRDFDAAIIILIGWLASIIRSFQRFFLSLLCLFEMISINWNVCLLSGRVTNPSKKRIQFSTAAESSNKHWHISADYSMTVFFWFISDLNIFFSK